ncbi:MAG: (deoxy)nucleoside triphosphate pyrophosphohydrolase [Candidatus Binatia bacterium]
MSKEEARVGVQVVAALIYQGQRVLACQRTEQGPFPLKWEFPGGKVEEGESFLTALQREIREELGIEVRSAQEIFRHRHLYPDQLDVELIFFSVESYTGVIENRSFHQLLWVKPEKLTELDFLEGDLPFIDTIIRRKQGY